MYPPIATDFPLDAQTNTVQVPFTIDVFFTQTIPTNTLFTTVCSSLPPSVPPSVPPTSQSSQGASSSVLTLTTPPPLTSLVLSSSTLDDGQVTIIYQTVVSTPPPTSVYVPTTGLVQETHSSTSNAPAHLGVILGASLGGAFGLFLVMALFWWLRFAICPIYILLHTNESIAGDVATDSTKCSKNQPTMISATKQPSVPNDSISTTAIPSPSPTTTD